MAQTGQRQARLLALIGPTITALGSALPLYQIAASDGLWRGRLQADEHALLLLFLLGRKSQWQRGWRVLGCFYPSAWLQLFSS